MHDESLDPNSNAFLIFFSEGINKFLIVWLDEVNNAVPTKNSNFIYNTIIWTQLPKWMLDAKINLLQSTKVWIIPGQICELCVCASDTPRAPKTAFSILHNFASIPKILCNKEVTFSIPSFHSWNYLAGNCSAYWKGWQRSFPVNKESMSSFQKVEIGECKSDEGEK